MKFSEVQLLLYTTSVASIKVFSFNSSDDNDPPSSAVLLQNPPRQALPNKFTVCFAMKQDKMDGRSPFLIRDRNGQPWIAFSIWNQGGQLGLWGEVGKRHWKMFHLLEKPWKFWSHICGEIDTLTGNISVSIDGRPSVTKNFEKLREGKPTDLDQKLQIGFSDTDIENGGKQSFRGQVSNVHFHFFDGSKSSEFLSKKPCEIKGSYLAWSDMTFKINGDDVHKLEETEKEVCSVQTKFYNVALPGKITWVQANHLCKALGGGTMTEIKDEADLNKFASQMRKMLCPTVWLPLADEKNEGVWENTNLNLESKFLRWADGQPNGFRTQNHAALFIENLHFGDFNAEELHCAACTLYSKAVLTLRGVCKNSYLGKFYYIVYRISIVITFSDTTFVAIHDGTHFKLSGSFYTDLWYKHS